MNVKVLAVGKIKDGWLREGIMEYFKRLKSLATIEVYEVKEEKAPEGLSLKNMEQIKEKEGQALWQQVKKGDYNIALDLAGQSYDSIELAYLFKQLALSGRPNVNFLIGGSLGLSDEILQQCDLRLSISAMTFPHQLCRLILAEQIYRAFSINANLPYHK